MTESMIDFIKQVAYIFTGDMYEAFIPRIGRATTGNKY